MAGLQTTVSEFLEEVASKEQIAVGSLSEDNLNDALNCVFATTPGVNAVLVGRLVDSLLIVARGDNTEEVSIDLSTSLISALISHQDDSKSSGLAIDGNSEIR